VGVTSRLADYLPSPIVAIVEPATEAEPPLFGFSEPAQSIGRMRAFHGNFGVLVRAYAYIRMQGAAGLRAVADHAVLNANYLRALLQDTYTIPYNRVCMHEFVAEGRWQEASGIGAIDVAKRLIDYAVHPPTVKFPLIVPEALMIEPTETESKQSVDAFADALRKIAGEAHTDPDLLRDAPHSTPVLRLDEVRAAKQPVLTWKR
jgi:glycine dehydrogenase subunit 2